MRRSRRGPLGRGRSVGEAEHCTNTGLTRFQRATPVAALFVAFALIAVGMPTAASAQSTNAQSTNAQSTNDHVAATRAAIDDVANRWFAAQRAAAQLDDEITHLQQRVDGMRDHIAQTQKTATARALLIYKGASSVSLGSVVGSDALDSARRAELIARANSENRRAMDALSAQTADLAAHRRDLLARRAEMHKALDSVASERRALDEQLSVLRARARSEAAVAALATARLTTRRTAAAMRPVSTLRSSQTTATVVAASTTTNGPATSSSVSSSSGGVSPHHNDPFLVCTRARESSGIYTAVSPAGYYGAYQFSTSTWDATASHAGRLSLIGVLPSRASEYDQDELAWTLYQWQGKAPWGGRC
jgi:peptidoglycan hydrolase CwlO-like protein